VRPDKIAWRQEISLILPMEDISKYNFHAAADLVFGVAA